MVTQKLHSSFNWRIYEQSYSRFSSHKSKIRLNSLLYSYKVIKEDMNLLSLLISLKFIIYKPQWYITSIIYKWNLNRAEKWKDPVSLVIPFHYIDKAKLACFIHNIRLDCSCYRTKQAIKVLIHNSDSASSYEWLSLGGNRGLKEVLLLQAFNSFFDTFFKRCEFQTQALCSFLGYIVHCYIWLFIRTPAKSVLSDNIF